MENTAYTNKLGIKNFSTLIVCFLCLYGCASPEQALVISKTSVGLDIEASPPTMSVAYSRKEGVFAPKYNKDALPVLATVNKKVGFFDIAVGQGMATGKSAVVISKYLTSNAMPASVNTIDDDAIEKESKLDIPITEKSRPYFFGTDTVYGFNISFNATNAMSGVNLGYKRKEVAYASISKKTVANDQNKVSVSMPSLLALSQMSSDIQDVNNNGLVYEQIFATGSAATNMTKHPQIRQKLGIKLVPLSTADKQEINNEIKELKAKRLAEYASRQTQSRVDKIIQSIGSLDDEEAKELEQNPPINNIQTVNNLINRADKNNSRQGNATLSRQYLKMRVTMGSRTAEELSIWENRISLLRKSR